MTNDPSLERIRKLALDELAHQPKARPWWKDALLLSGLNGLMAVACTVALGLGRKGMVLNEAAPPVLIAVAAPIVLTFLVGAVTAVMPGRHARAFGLLALAAIAAAAVIMGGSGNDDARSLMAQGMPCMRSELLMAVVPTFGAILVLARFSYDPLRMFVGGLAAGAAGLFALHLHCPIGTVTHLALFHVLPWVAAAVIAVAVRARVKSKSYAP